MLTWLTFVGACRKCNSSHCQCDVGLTPNIAPASPSPGPMSVASASPYSLAFSPSFTSVAPSQMRASSYPSPVSYSSPQFTGMPAFNNSLFRTPQSPSLTNNQNLTAHVQNFQRRQEQLMASTRRMQQEAQLTRKQSRDGTTPYGQLHSISPSQGLDPYQHRTSLAINYNPVTHSDPNLSHHLNLPSPSYPSLPITDPAHTDAYRYLHDNSNSLTAAFPYAASLSNLVYRPSSNILHPQRKTPVPMTRPAIQTSDDRNNRHESPQTTEHQLHHSTTDDHPPRKSSDTIETSSTHPEKSKLEVQPAPPEQETSQGPTDHELINHEEVADIFSGFEKVGIEGFDTADNEWLYALDTPCARPGSVCECGDSCCCPGCFTHTNNPGDRGVYNTMLDKFGGILAGDNKGGRETNSSSTCLPTTTGNELQGSNPQVKL